MKIDKSKTVAIVGSSNNNSLQNERETLERAKSLEMPVKEVSGDFQLSLWWENLPSDIKSLFSGINNERDSAYNYLIFWDKVDSENRTLLYTYWKYRSGMIKLSPDEANSLEIEIISELSETMLEIGSGVSRYEMYDDDRQYYEDFQDKFNDLYDDLEERLSLYDFLKLRQE